MSLLGKRGLVAPCHRAHPLSLYVLLHLCRADRGVHGGRNLSADRGCGLLVQVIQGCWCQPQCPCAHRSLFLRFLGMWGVGGEAIAVLAVFPRVQRLLVRAGGQWWDTLVPCTGSWEQMAPGLGITTALDADTPSMSVPRAPAPGGGGGCATCSSEEGCGWEG